MPQKVKNSTKITKYKTQKHPFYIFHPDFEHFSSTRFWNLYFSSRF